MNCLLPVMENVLVDLANFMVRSGCIQVSPALPPNDRFEVQHLWNRVRANVELPVLLSASKSCANGYYLI